MQPVIIVLCGLPGSGKTSLSHYLAAMESVIISTDDIIGEHADLVGITYDEAFPLMIDVATKRAAKIFQEALARGDNIIYDQTNLSVKKRKSILDQVGDSYKKFAIFFEIDEGVRQERLASREGKTIPKHVDEMMKKSYVRPSVEEGFDGVYGLVNNRIEKS